MPKVNPEQAPKPSRQRVSCSGLAPARVPLELKPDAPLPEAFVIRALCARTFQQSEDNCKIGGQGDCIPGTRPPDCPDNQGGSSVDLEFVTRGHRLFPHLGSISRIPTQRRKKIVR